MVPSRSMSDRPSRSMAQAITTSNAVRLGEVACSYRLLYRPQSCFRQSSGVDFVFGRVCPFAGKRWTVMRWSGRDGDAPRKVFAGIED
jgi:hypothetical protein